MGRREIFYLAILLGAVVGFPRLRKALIPEDATQAEMPQSSLVEDRVPDGETLEAFFETLETGTFSGVGGVPIAYAVANPKEVLRNLVIVPGFTESYLKYGETLRLFTSKGYRVFILDHRGMGLSGRLGNGPQIVHVERFRHYVEDLETFFDEVVVPRAKGPVDVLGHSTGGLITTFALHERPDWFRRVVLSAPLLGVITGPLPEWLAYAIAWGQIKLGRAKDYAPGFDDFTPEKEKASFRRVTSSAARIQLEIELYGRHPEILAGGPSNGWVFEAISATREAMPLAPRIKQPILLLQAETDYYSRAEDQEAFCAKAPNCRLVRYTGSRHELLRETDGIRDKVLTDLFAFLEAGA